MRTLFEIIEAAKDGNKPTHDECYWAMLALSALHTFDGQDLLSLHKASDEKPSPARLTFLAEESFNRSKRCFAVPPQQYVGWNNDPSNPEYQKQRQIALKVYRKVTGDQH